MSLFAELKRRNVFRVGIAYVLMGWAMCRMHKCREGQGWPGAAVKVLSSVAT